MKGVSRKEKFGNSLFDDTLHALDSFELDLRNKLSKYSKDYERLCYASLRQSIGAHKLVLNKDNELIYISKECHSNGCTSTVDITYPAMPLYLLYNPELVAAMVRPIFKFAKMPIWKFPYAPHDSGTYPYCLGQVYGLISDEKILVIFGNYRKLSASLKTMKNRITTAFYSY